MAETRTPEAVAREARIIARKPYMREEDVDKELAALIREERKRIFAAGADAGQQCERDAEGGVPIVKVLKDLADRERLAVEGRSDG